MDIHFFSMAKRLIISGINCLASIVSEVKKQFYFFMRKSEAFILKLKYFKCIGIHNDAMNEMT